MRKKHKNNYLNAEYRGNKDSSLNSKEKRKPLYFAKAFRSWLCRLLAAGWGCLMLTVPDTTRNAIASDISILTNMIVKLYSWVNILDKLGPQKALYRYNNAQ